MSEPWLVIIDPQTIFASPTSQWGSRAFPDIIDPINRGPPRTRYRDEVDSLGPP